MKDRFFRLMGNSLSVMFSTKKNRRMYAVSIMIVCAALTLFGIYSAAEINITAFMRSISENLEINVYLKSDNGGRTISQIEGDLLAIDDVSAVRFLSREDRLLKVTEEIYDSDDTDTDFYANGENPLRDSYVITVKDAAKAENVVSDAEKIVGVEEVVKADDVFVSIGTLIRNGKFIGWFLMAAFMLLGIFILSGTVNLEIDSMEKEIGIMKLIGATDGYIAAPFVVRAVILGLISALIGFLLSVLGYFFVCNGISNGVYTLINLVPMSYVAPILAIRLLGTGVIISGITGLVAIKFKLNKYNGR